MAGMFGGPNDFKCESCGDYFAIESRKTHSYNRINHLSSQLNEKDIAELCGACYGNFVSWRRMTGVDRAIAK